MVFVQVLGCVSVGALGGSDAGAGVGVCWVVVMLVLVLVCVGW